MADEQKRPVGRPPQGGPTPQRSLRIGDSEWAELLAAAKRAGKSFTEWALDILLRAARKK